MGVWRIGEAISRTTAWLNQASRHQEVEVEAAADCDRYLADQSEHEPESGDRV